MRSSAQPFKAGTAAAYWLQIEVSIESFLSSGKYVQIYVRVHFSVLQFSFNLVLNYAASLVLKLLSGRQTFNTAPLIACPLCREGAGGTPSKNRTVWASNGPINLPPAPHHLSLQPSCTFTSSLPGSAWLAPPVASEVGQPPGRPAHGLNAVPVWSQGPCAQYSRRGVSEWLFVAAFFSIEFVFGGSIACSKSPQTIVLMCFFVLINKHKIHWLETLRIHWPAAEFWPPKSKTVEFDRKSYGLSKITFLKCQYQSSTIFALLSMLFSVKII